MQGVILGGTLLSLELGWADREQHRRRAHSFHQGVGRWDQPLCGHSQDGLSDRSQANLEKIMTGPWGSVGSIGDCSTLSEPTIILLHFLPKKLNELPGNIN